MKMEHTLFTFLFGILLTIGPINPCQSENLKIGDGTAWSFLGGDWSENQEGVIRPLDKMNLHSRTFYTKKAYSDFTAEFEFNGDYRETGTGSAGLIFRAKDSNHCYFVYFPWGGQQLRAKHFWAMIAKIDGDGYWRNIQAEWVPGVPSETDRWFKVRVVAEGPDIQVLVDGRRALHITDASYKSGCVGLSGYGWYAFRNVQISGREVSPPAWDNNAQIPTHNFTLELPGDKMPSGCMAPNGDVLLAGGNQLVRSKDKGRSWEEPETLPEKLGEVTDYGSSMFRTSDNRLIVMVYRTQDTVQKPAPEILISESTDNGRTWSDPVPSQVASEWPEQPKNLVPYGPLLESRDHTLIRFLLGGVKVEEFPFSDVRTWGSIHCKALVIRSTDGGKSWSAPIELDRPSWCNAERGTIPGSLDFTEPTGVIIGDTVTVLIRPIYSPMMWQCWSYDAGATWDAAVRATFPGYAQSMVRTKSGAILCAHRYPHYSVNISYDDGLHWDAGTVIDYPVWAMGCMVEVEPDVVLATYMNAQRSDPLLGQLIRVSSEGIEPILCNKIEE
ncbi:MAG: sialidase family protein [bacterium]